MLTLSDVQASFDKVNAKIASATGSSDSGAYTKVVNEVDDCKARVTTFGNQGNPIGTAVAHLTDARNWVSPSSRTLGQCPGEVALAHTQIFGF